MKFHWILSAVLALGIAEHNKTSLDAFITNPKLLMRTTQCFLDKGPCDSTASYVKMIFPNLIQTTCEHCTPAQKQLMKRFLEEIEKTSPEDLKALKEKYDPKSKYINALTKTLNNV